MVEQPFSLKPVTWQHMHVDKDSTSIASTLPIALHVETMKIGHLQADFHGRAESTVENLCVIIKVVDQTILIRE
jgi:hypothetical protein